MNKIKREEREDLHTFSDTTQKQHIQGKFINGNSGNKRKENE